MNASLLVHLEGAWWAAEQETLHELAPFPVIDKPTVVITDFGGAITGVIAVKGKAKYAEAFIERKLRADGQVDGECKIFIHLLVPLGEGFQALYSAVPIEQWQRLASWSALQPGHCLVLPLLDVLCRRLEPGKGVVVRLEQRVLFCALEKSRLLFHTAVILGDHQEDIGVAVDMLASRVGEQQPDSLGIAWCVIGGRAQGDEQAFLQLFANVLESASVSLMPGLRAADWQAGERLSSAAALWPLIAPWRALNAAKERLAFLAERHAARLVPLFLGLSGVALAVATYWYVLAGQAEAATARTRAAITELEEQQWRLSESEDIAAAERDLPLVVAFAEVLGLADPYREIADIGSASARGQGIRILRISGGRDEQGRYLFVDAAVDDVLREDQVFGSFVNALRDKGYTVHAPDSSSEAPAKTDGYFSLRLDRAEWSL